MKDVRPMDGYGLGIKGEGWDLIEGDGFAFIEPDEGWDD